MRLAGVCINGGACGLIRQYTGNLTNRRLPCAWVFASQGETRRTGAAWLSSVRVLRCGIELPNEHNPHKTYRLPNAVIRVYGLHGFGISPGVQTLWLGRGRSQVNMASIDWATHVLQGWQQRAARAKALANPQNPPQFGLRIATHAHEVETVSNRASRRHGEAPPNSAHTAHHARKVYKVRCAKPGLWLGRAWTTMWII
jgi:hypothetical protein